MDPDRPVTASSADRSRAWRARQGARTGIIGRPRTEECGTHAAYVRHRRVGEVACDACRLAEADYQRARRIARQTGR